MITSSALLHLQINNCLDVLPDYLSVVLNSDAVQLQAQRDAGGSIIKHWKPSEIDEVLIPILDIAKQQAISEKVLHSFYLRHRSKQLLDCTKYTIEMAIEHKEASAIVWLNNQINDCIKEKK